MLARAPGSHVASETHNVMAWDHPNAKPLRVQILEDIVLHSTPAGCVADTPEPPRHLHLVKSEPPDEAA